MAFLRLLYKTTPFSLRMMSSTRVSESGPMMLENREQITYGCNGQPGYTDTVLYPFPSIRWMENSPDVLAMREREKGDWKQLTIHEKKCIYRSNFRLTIAETIHPTGEWKWVVGYTLVLVSIGVWLFILQKMFVYPPRPESFSEEWRAAQLRRVLDLHQQPFTGPTYFWDYQNNTWKTRKNRLKEY